MKIEQIISTAILPVVFATLNVSAQDQSKMDPVVSAKATKENPWENSLGLRFVPVPGTKVLFSIWDTRVQDYSKFVEESGHNSMYLGTKDVGGAMYSVDKTVPRGMSRQGASWKDPGFAQGPTHPVVGVSWDDAKAFCKWLTRKERDAGKIAADQEYRLPTDEEWSIAVGSSKYPWGDEVPPPQGGGNYAGSEAKDEQWPANWRTVEGYRDDYPRTSPVGSFLANQYGLYDMGGNVQQMLEDYYNGSMNSEEIVAKHPYYKPDNGPRAYRVLRGGSWRSAPVASFTPYIDPVKGRISPFHDFVAPNYRYCDRGFRCVLVIGAMP